MFKFLLFASLANIQQLDEPECSSVVSSEPGCWVTRENPAEPVMWFSHSPASPGRSAPSYGVFLVNSLIFEHSPLFLNPRPLHPTPSQQTPSALCLGAASGHSSLASAVSPLPLFFCARGRAVRSLKSKVKFFIWNHPSPPPCSGCLLIQQLFNVCWLSHISI